MPEPLPDADQSSGLQRLDRKNQATSCTYDGLDHLAQVTYADQSTITYTYDAGNRRT